jgi:hypothetical protein
VTVVVDDAGPRLSLINQFLRPSHAAYARGSRHSSSRCTASAQRWVRRITGTDLAGGLRATVVAESPPVRHIAAANGDIRRPQRPGGGAAIRDTNGDGRPTGPPVLRALGGRDRDRKRRAVFRSERPAPDSLAPGLPPRLDSNPARLPWAGHASGDRHRADGGRRPIGSLTISRRPASPIAPASSCATSSSAAGVWRFDPTHEDRRRTRAREWPLTESDVMSIEPSTGRSTRSPHATS